MCSGYSERCIEVRRQCCSGTNGEAIRTTPLYAGQYNALLLYIGRVWSQGLHEDTESQVGPQLETNLGGEGNVQLGKISGGGGLLLVLLAPSYKKF